MSLPTEPALQPHRNHGLFSDHYLDVTLPERPGWRSMVEQAQPVMEVISHLFALLLSRDSGLRSASAMATPWMCSDHPR